MDCESLSRDTCGHMRTSDTCLARGLPVQCSSPRPLPAPGCHALRPQLGEGLLRTRARGADAL